MPTRAYYRVTPLRYRTPWGRLVLRRLDALRGLPRPPAGDGRDYTGWTARALNSRDVPAGTVGRVVAVQDVGTDGLVHVIDFRPLMELHVPLPWPSLELIAPQAACNEGPLAVADCEGG